MRYAWFISDHGFGHVMRNVPLIQNMLEQDKANEIYVVTGIKQGEALHQQISDERLHIYPHNVDCGWLVKPSSLQIDKVKLESEVRKFISKFSGLQEWGTLFLKENHIEKIIVDIVPWIIPVGAKLGIKTILISNFTWVENYEEFLPEELIQPIRDCYLLADEEYLYELATRGIQNMFPKAKKIGFVCRRFNDIKIAQNKSEHHRPIVFLSVGCSNSGINGMMNVEDLPYDFIVTNGIKYMGTNVYRLPKEIPDSHNYLAASDYCITKAGWTTVAECVLSKTPFAVIERKQVLEDRVTIQQLTERGMADKIREEDIYNKDKICKILKHRIGI